MACSNLYLLMVCQQNLQFSAEEGGSELVLAGEGEEDRTDPQQWGLRYLLESLSKSKADIEKTTGPMAKQTPLTPSFSHCLGFSQTKPHHLWKSLTLKFSTDELPAEDAMALGWGESWNWFPFLSLITQCGLQWALGNSVLITERMAGGVSL